MHNNSMTVAHALPAAILNIVDALNMKTFANVFAMRIDVDVFAINNNVTALPTQLAEFVFATHIVDAVSNTHTDKFAQNTAIATFAFATRNKDIALAMKQEEFVSSTIECAFTTLINGTALLNVQHAKNKLAHLSHDLKNRMIFSFQNNTERNIRQLVLPTLFSIGMCWDNNRFNFLVLGSKKNYSARFMLLL